MRRAWLVGAVAGCSALSPGAVLKSPATDQCEAADLKGCPDLVQGVLLYVEGDKAGGEAKVRLAAGANSPEAVKVYSQKLRDLSSLPGAGGFAQPLNEIAAILEKGAPASPSATPPPEEVSGAPPQVGQAPAVVPASDEFERLRTDSVLLAAQPNQPCKLGILDGLCGTRRFRGPLVVTDVVTGRGCTDQLFAGAQEGEKQELKWLVDASHPGIHGAALVVRRGDFLFLATVPSGVQPSNDPRCMLTWSAYRPRVASKDDE